MNESTADASLKEARAWLNAVLQSDQPLSLQEQSLAEIVQMLVNALSELQTTNTHLHQQYQDVVARHNVTLEEYNHFQAVGTIAHSLRSSLNPAEVLKLAAAATRKLFQVDRVVIYGLKPTGEAVAEAEVAQPDCPPLASVPIEATFLDSLMRSQQSRAISLLDTDLLAEAADYLRQHQIQTALMVPLLSEERRLGWLEMHSCQPRSWTKTEADSLRQIAAEMTIALQQADLYQRSQRLNAELEEQVQQRTTELQTALKYESMLKRITDKVRDSLDEGQILQTVVRELTSVVGLTGCNAALYDLARNTSTIRYEYSRSAPMYQGKVAQMDDFPEIYDQLKRGMYFQFCSLLPNPKRGRVTMLACPIFVDPQLPQGGNQAVLGDLWLIHDKDHIFHEFEIRLAQQVANHCAIAIRQVRLYQAAQAQVHDLEILNRLKDEFLSTVSHELRTPITNVRLAIRMLKIAQTEERRNYYLDILEKEASREADLINNLLDLQQLESASFPIRQQSIDLISWVSQLVSPFYTKAAFHQQALTVNYPAELPPLVSDAAVLRRVLTELLDNACKYTAAGGEIALILAEETAANSPSVTTITVRNQATIPAAELPKIFDKFYRCPAADPWSQGGTGLGLALVQKLVHQLQGTITVESAEGWTMFVVRLPQQSAEA